MRNESTQAAPFILRDSGMRVHQALTSSAQTRQSVAHHIAVPEPTAYVLFRPTVLVGYVMPYPFISSS